MGFGLATLADARLLGRHQVAAAGATAVDFALMVALVELGGVPAAAAAVLSAMSGGATNFTLARLWAFRARHQGTLASQAARYAAVSTGGALLNGALLGAILEVLDAPYVVLRVAVAVAVSVAYSYPMHTRVVFRLGEDR